MRYVRLYVSVQALLSDQIDFSFEGRIEFLNQPHVTDHPRRTAETHQDVDVALRPIFTACDATKDRGIAYAILPEYGTRPQFDFFDGHTLFIPLCQGKSMYPTLQGLL